MLILIKVGEQVAKRRKAKKWTQLALSRKAGVSRATLDALDNGLSGEIGFTKLSRILTSSGLELTLREASFERPPLEDLLEEDRHAQSLGRRR